MVHKVQNVKNHFHIILYSSTITYTSYHSLKISYYSVILLKSIRKMRIYL